MENDDATQETSNVDLDEMRQLRVKVSVRTLVHLQYFRLTQAKGISEVVNDALNAYFEGIEVPGAKAPHAPRLPEAAEIRPGSPAQAGPGNDVPA